MNEKADSRRSCRMFVVGLDGATFAALDPLVAQGKLPHMKRLMEEGAATELFSTVPPVTGPAWTSFMTGKKPENHGVFDFVRAQPSSYGRRIISYGNIKSQTLWSLLSKHGKRICVVNVPITYPPPEVNGVLISGMLTPETAPNFTYPPELKKALLENVGEYILDVVWQRYSKNRDTVKIFLEALLHCTRQRIRACQYLLDSDTFDFFMVVFIGTDRIQHFLWDYIQRGIIENSSDACGDEKDREIVRLITYYYQEVDRFIGTLLEKMDEDASLIVMSDHGFGKLKGEFSVNVWLESCGLLAFHPKKIRMLRLKGNLEPVRTLVRKLDVLKLRRLLMPKPAGNAGRMKSYEFLDCIDWSKTKAYSISSTEQGIYVNLQGREPNGIVKPGVEYENLRDRIIDELRKLIDPLTNEPLVNEVYRREEIYQGKYVAEAPDIIFFLKGGEYVASVIPKDSLFECANLQMGTGTHRPAGILMGVGGGIKEAAQIPQLNIYDLTPTILYLMGAPVPDDMDGEVAWNMLKEEYVNTHSLTYAAGASVSTASGESDAYTVEEEQEIRDQLKNLGYME